MDLRALFVNLKKEAEMIKMDITENSISFFQGESRVDAMIARGETGIHILFKGIPISLGDIISELTN